MQMCFAAAALLIAAIAATQVESRPHFGHSHGHRPVIFGPGPFRPSRPNLNDIDFNDVVFYCLYQRWNFGRGNSFLNQICPYVLAAISNRNNNNTTVSLANSTVTDGGAISTQTTVSQPTVTTQNLTAVTTQNLTTATTQNLPATTTQNLPQNQTTISGQTPATTRAIGTR